jgi:hypothetical protein
MVYCILPGGNGASYNTLLQQVQDCSSQFSTYHTPLAADGARPQDTRTTEQVSSSRKRGVSPPGSTGPCQGSGRLAKARHSPRASLWQRVWRALVRGSRQDTRRGGRKLTLAERGSSP